MFRTEAEGWGSLHVWDWQRCHKKPKGTKWCFSKSNIHRLVTIHFSNLPIDSPPFCPGLHDLRIACLNTYNKMKAIALHYNIIGDCDIALHWHDWQVNTIDGPTKLVRQNNFLCELSIGKFLAGVIRSNSDRAIFSTVPAQKKAGCTVLIYALLW